MHWHHPWHVHLLQLSDPTQSLSAFASTRFCIPTNPHSYSHTCAHPNPHAPCICSVLSLRHLAGVFVASGGRGRGQERGVPTRVCMEFVCTSLRPSAPPRNRPSQYSAPRIACDRHQYQQSSVGEGAGCRPWQVRAWSRSCAQMQAHVIVKQCAVLAPQRGCATLLSLLPSQASAHAPAYPKPPARGHGRGPFGLPAGQQARCAA